MKKKSKWSFDVGWMCYMLLSLIVGVLIMAEGEPRTASLIVGSILTGAGTAGIVLGIKEARNG